jgi:hypothetical protein
MLSFTPRFLLGELPVAAFRMKNTKFESENPRMEKTTWLNYA